MLLIELDGGLRHRVAPRARSARGLSSKPTAPAQEPSVVSLREIARRRRRARVAHARASTFRRPVARIHPHYGVFAPVRREYVDLVAKAPLPAAIAMTSARIRHRHRHRRARGGARAPRHRSAWSPPISIRVRWPVRARTSSASALATRCEVVEADLFPAGRAALVRVQSAVGAGAPELAAGARHLRSGEPDAARLSRRCSARTSRRVAKAG